MTRTATNTDFSDEQTDTHSNAIAGIREGIVCLQEYCNALISSGVTGQIDVRDEV